jgi:acyl-CoA hydrolase
MVEFVLPNDTNTHGNALGGRVMHWIDLAAGLSAMRFSGQPVVTASVDELHFLSPVRLGETAVLQAEVTQAWHSSLEVHVQVHAEDMLHGTRRPTTTAYLTFVAVDGKGRPVAVPPIKLRTPAEERRARQADVRRKHRQESRKRIYTEMGIES